MTGDQPKAQAAKKKPAARDDADTDHSNDSQAEFFHAFGSNVPAQNLWAILGWYYKEYGKESITVTDVRETAKAVGLTIPDRPNDAISQKKQGGKTLFQGVRRGTFKPTVNGEKFLQDMFSIKPGTKSRESGAE